MMRATTTLALTTAALLLSGSAAVAQSQVDFNGMDCAEKATHLRTMVERNEIHDDEAERLQADVTRALTRCRNGDDEAFAELATQFETRQWNATEDPMDG